MLMAGGFKELHHTLVEKGQRLALCGRGQEGPCEDSVQESSIHPFPEVAPTCNHLALASFLVVQHLNPVSLSTRLPAHEP